MVSAELAITLPAAVLVLVGILLTGSVSAAQVRVTEAARSGARALSIGQSLEAATDIAVKLAGPESTLLAEPSGMWVTVRVRRPAPALLGLVGIEVVGQASIPREDRW